MSTPFFPQIPKAITGREFVINHAVVATWRSAGDQKTAKYGLVLHIGKPAISECISHNGGIWIPRHHLTPGALGTRCARTSLEECMKSFLFGFGLGIGLGVLFAPMSGEQTRRNLADRANDLADTARETTDQIRDRVRSGMSAIRGGAEQRPTGTEGNV